MFSRRDFLNVSAAGGSSLFLAHVLGCSSAPEPGAALPVTPASETASPWWLKGNYRPIADEIEVADLAIEGALPPGLDGVFLRNGPNVPEGTSTSWLFGDGMLHGVRLEKGRARWYKNRYIQTASYLKRASRTSSVELMANTANTALIRHGSDVLALYEGGLPYAIDLNTLATRGQHDYAGTLTRPMSPHPKIDTATGEMAFVGYSPFPPYLTFHVVSAKGALVRSVEIPIAQPRMVHDFQLTATYAVFLDLPVTFDLDAARAGGFPFIWRPELGARIGFLKRAGGTEVTWIDLPPCYVFHTLNAYEDDAGHVIMTAARHPTIWAKGLDDESWNPVAWQWTIDVVARRLTERQIDDRLFEFPRIDARRQCRPNRYAYGLRFGEVKTPGTPKMPEGLLKYDLKTGAADAFEFAEHEQPDEAVFAAGGDGEDAGWLLTMVYDAKRDGSDLVVVDASNVSKGPIARIRMPRRVPFGFHGEWFPS